MFTVIISEKGGQQTKYDFNKTEITIGRMKGNDIVLPKGNVSKQHTRIFKRDNGFYIADMGSTNGTYVNGRKVIASEQSLADVDKIYIGDFILQLEARIEARIEAIPLSKGPPQPPRPPTGNPAHRGDIRDTMQQSVAPFGQAAPPERGFSPASIANIPVEPLRPSGAFPQPAGPTPAPFAAPGPFAGPAIEEQLPKLDFDDIGFELLDSSPDNSRTPIPEPRRNFPSSEQSSHSLHTNPTPAPDAGPAMRRSTGAGLPAASLAQPSRQPAKSAPAAPQPAALEPFQAAPSQDQSAPHPAHKLRLPEPLLSEFDPDFHANQHDIARILFETISIDELSLEYPPLPEGRSSAENSVRKAIVTVNPHADRPALQELITTELVGLGVLEKYLDDASISEIYVNRFDRILIRKNGQLILASRVFSHPDFLLLAAQRLLGTRDSLVSADEVRFSDGTRVHIVMPPVSASGPVLTVRKPATHHASLDELVEQSVLSAGMAQFLLGAVEAGRSILIAGPTSSGKTTILGALARAVSPASRLIAVEETSNLALTQESAVQLETSINFDLRYLVRQAIAMHPQRILLDECRGPEAYDWITAAASGTEGSMMTTHGSTTLDALARLETLAMLGSTDSNPRGLREQIARAIDLIVVLNRAPNGGFLVHKITEIQGIDLDAFRLSDIYYYRVEGTEGSFHPTGYIPHFFEDLRHLGIQVDFGIFRE